MSDVKDHLFDDRIRRTFLLANYCIANIAAYRVNWKTIAGVRSLRVNNDLWVRANGAFFDMAVIEWCKLFTDGKNGKHHWTKTFTDEKKWKIELLGHIAMSSDEYDIEIDKIKAYRDKYVAHLDHPKTMNYPLTEFMLKTVSYLYDSLKNDSSTKLCLGSIYDSADNFYKRMMNEYNQEIELRLESDQ